MPLANGAAIAVLLGTPWIVSYIRSRRTGIERTLDNTPVLLMDGLRMLEDNMR